MFPSYQKYIWRPILVLAGLIVFSLLIIPGTSQAGMDWLKKGADIFNAIQKEDAPATPAAPAIPGMADLSGAFKEALRIGTEKVVAQLGASDGFNADPAIHIPLPAKFDTVRSVLGKVGMDSSFEDLELRLNRAAEAATPKAKKIFFDSVSAMTFDDVMTLYKGPEDAATRYFQDKMTPALTEAMTPIVNDSLSEVGAIQLYDRIMGQYQSMPFVPDVKADLLGHVLDKGLAGIFLYVAKEEAAIRNDPARRTTDLLKRVFGSQ
jgi:Protein of unknown function (DUF4197)